MTVLCYIAAFQRFFYVSNGHLPEKEGKECIESILFVLDIISCHWISEASVTERTEV